MCLRYVRGLGTVSHEFLRLIKEWHVAINKTSEGLSLDGLVGLELNSLRTVSPLRNDRTGSVTEQMSFETPFSLTYVHNERTKKKASLEDLL